MAGRLLTRIAAPLVIAAALWTPGTAAGAKIVTWDGPAVSESRFVDPAAAPPGSYNEPPGVGDRPNALRVNVFKPDGFDRDRRYPVLYLLHGQGDGYDSLAHPERGNLREVVAGFPGLIVMPEADRGFYANWWNGGARADPAWERYHLDELIPLVERRLPIRRGRRWHAIAGLSMGGEGTMFYASQRPGYFGSAASFSGSLSIQRPSYQLAFEAGSGQDPEAIFGDPAAQRFYWVGHNPAALVENLRHTRLYVAAGNGIPNPLSLDEVGNVFGQLTELELSMHAAEFVEAAGDAGVAVTYAPHQGIHDWPYWHRDLANTIDWGLFKEPPRPRGSWSYRTVAQVGEAWSLRFRFAEPPGSLVTFAREGRKLSGMGSGEVTIRKATGCSFSAELPFTRRLPRRCR